uniref:Ribosomal protein S11 n=1 Tax=Toxarium undulatum TaxID=210620 RepID=A0A2U9GIT9_9STRA|nr:ribosomal protein S11 [Toxarium undulatum]AWQ64142.1 ribosomal protein S11 [Toxarium undulatum]
MFLSKLVNYKTPIEEQIIKKLKTSFKRKKFSFFNVKKNFKFLLNNNHFLSSSIYFSALYNLKNYQTLELNHHPISCIVNIRVTHNNLFINISDYKGKTKCMFTTSSLIRHKTNARRSHKQFGLLVKIFKRVVTDFKRLRKSFIRINFRNTHKYQELVIIKILRKLFFIRSIQNYRLQPFNGCRPRKLRRVRKKRKRR